MAGDCNRKINPTGNAQLDSYKKGDVIVFNFDPPIKFPCHEKVIVNNGADLQQESGNSFQIKMTAASASVQVDIWCNALNDDDSEGLVKCTQTYTRFLGKKVGYFDCFKHCFGDLIVGAVALGCWLAIFGALIGAIVAGPSGAVVGGFGAFLIPPTVGTVYCTIKCFFETL